MALEVRQILAVPAAYLVRSLLLAAARLGEVHLLLVLLVVPVEGGRNPLVQVEQVQPVKATLAAQVTVVLRSVQGVVVVLDQ